MLFDNIDINKKYKFSLILTRKNEKPICILSEAMDKVLVRNEETFDTLSFKIPYYTLDVFNTRQVLNPNYDKVVEEEMVLLKCGEDLKNPIFQGYFVIKEVSESSEELVKTVECVSREVVLNRNPITIDGTERVLHNNNNGILDLFEQETTWKVNYIQPSVLTDNINGGTVPRVRWIDALSKPWYQILNDEIQSSYNVLIRYNSYNKTIDVYDRDSYGEHTGLILSEENYVKNIVKSSKTENLITKLEVTGYDDLTFERVNIYGTKWIVNYDYFKNNGQMSNELVEALDKHNALLEIKHTQFKSIQDQLNVLNGNLTSKESELTTLKEELRALVAIQSACIPTQDNANLSVATMNVNNKNSAISSVQSQVNSLTTQINNLYSQLEQIGRDIDYKNAKDVVTNNLIFNAKLLSELEDFTFKDSWETNYYSNDTLLLEASKKRLLENSVPTIELNISLLDFLADVRGQRYWSKLNLGDFVRAYSPKLKTNVDLRIVSYSYSIDSNDLAITFSNKTKKLDDLQSYNSAVRKSFESSKQVNAKRLTWNQVKDTKNAVDKYFNNSLDMAKQNIIASQGRNKIDITENGQVVSDINNPNRQLILTAGQLAITTDGLTTVSTAINADGIVGEMIVGKILIGEKLYIQNANNSFRVTENGVEIASGKNIYMGDNQDFINAQARLTVNENQIALKANKVELDNLTGRVTSAEASISVQAGQISSKVSEIDFNGAKIASLINQTSKSISMSALNLDLTGFVTFNSLTTPGSTTINGANIATGTLSFINLKDKPTIPTKASDIGAMPSGYVPRWSEMLDKPFIPTSARDIKALADTWVGTTYIDSNGLYTGTIAANKINVGTLYGVNLSGQNLECSGTMTFKAFFSSQPSVIKFDNNGMGTIGEFKYWADKFWTDKSLNVGGSVSCSSLYIGGVEITATGTIAKFG